MASSVIRSAHYESQTSELDIEFVSGRVYRYFDVPHAIAEALERGPSMGRVFNAAIRDHYPCRRLRGKARTEPDP